MGLTVVTHMMKSWNRDMSRCIESVEKAMPPGGKHVIIDLESKQKFIDAAAYERARYDALELDEFITFVDDDDYISEDSLNLCLSAIQRTNVGIAFTNEVMIHANGSVTKNDGIKRYETIHDNQRTIHHLAMIRTSSVSEAPILVSKKCNAGVEWMIKAEAALCHGAIHVPVDGYYWIQHNSQWHHNPIWRDEYTRNKKIIGNEIRAWGSRHGDIPIWRINTP